MGAKRNSCRILMGGSQGRNHQEDVEAGQRIISKSIFREIGWGRMVCIDLAQDRGQWEGSCQHVYELQDSIKFWKILKQLSDRQIPKKDSIKLVVFFVGRDNRLVQSYSQISGHLFLRNSKCFVPFIVPLLYLWLRLLISRRRVAVSEPFWYFLLPL